MYFENSFSCFPSSFEYGTLNILASDDCAGGGFHIHFLAGGVCRLIVEAIVYSNVFLQHESIRSNYFRGRWREILNHGGEN